jgi:SAM-dependent methyltransferase
MRPVTDIGPHDPSSENGHALNTDHPHPARVYNHWLGGKDAFAADRQLAEQIARVAPWVVAGARENRAFIARATLHLASAGITQFIDIGAGLPVAANVHDIARRRNRGARVVYVDNDPVVLAHARALMATDTHTVAVAGDARDPDGILGDDEVRAHLDLSQPVAVIFGAVLHFLTEQDDPAGVISTFRDEMAPGSYLVVSHVADLGEDEQGVPDARATREAADLYDQLAASFVLRTPERISQWFTGFDLLPPGLVLAHRWRSARKRSVAAPVLAAVGRLAAPPVQTGGSRSGS